MSLYLTLMGCVSWTITIILTIVMIVKVVNSFRNLDTGLNKCKYILTLLAVIVMGVGIGILFNQVGNLIK